MFHINSISRVSFVNIVPNGQFMKCLEFAGSSLSTVAKTDEGQNTSSNHLNFNVLQMMSGAAFIYFSIVNI